MAQSHVQNSSFENHLYRFQVNEHDRLSELAQDNINTLELCQAQLHEQQSLVNTRRQEYRKDISLQTTISVAWVFFSSVLSYMGIAAATTAGGVPAMCLIVASLYQTARQLDNLQKMKEHSFQLTKSMTPAKRQNTTQLESSQLFIALDIAAAVSLVMFTGSALDNSSSSTLTKFGATALQTVPPLAKQVSEAKFKQKEALLLLASIDHALKKDESQKISEQIEEALERETAFTNTLKTCIEEGAKASTGIFQ